MKIAVITPSKPNRVPLLDECIASVWSQTKRAGTHAYEIDSLQEGPAIVRNRLVNSLPKEYDGLAFLDDDDIMLPTHLERLSAASENADVVYSLCNLNCCTREFDPAALRVKNYIPVTALVRRSIFEKVGGFNNVSMEDWHLWIKISHAGGRFIFVPEVTVTYRVQNDSRDMKAVGLI